VPQPYRRVAPGARWQRLIRRGVRACRRSRRVHLAAPALGPGLEVAAVQRYKMHVKANLERPGNHFISSRVVKPGASELWRN
jgi:hypothetical protein